MILFHDREVTSGWQTRGHPLAPSPETSAGYYGPGRKRAWRTAITRARCRNAGLNFSRNF